MCPRIGKNASNLQLEYERELAFQSNKKIKLSNTVIPRGTLWREKQAKKADLIKKMNLKPDIVFQTVYKISKRQTVQKFTRWNRLENIKGYKCGQSSAQRWITYSNCETHSRWNGKTAQNTAAKKRSAPFDKPIDVIWSKSYIRGCYKNGFY